MSLGFHLPRKTTLQDGISTLREYVHLLVLQRLYLYYLKDEPLAELIQRIADDIGGMTRYLGIALLYNKKILFPSSTLRGLNIWAGAEFRRH